jgi:hypothetical protein
MDLSFDVGCIVGAMVIDEEAGGPAFRALSPAWLNPRLTEAATHLTGARMKDAAN